MMGEHSCPRKEYNPYAPQRSNVLHCYGVDFLSTKDVLASLSDYAPKDIEWIDDSSCNIIFEGSEDVDRVRQELKLEGHTSEEPWEMSKPLNIGGKQSREFQLEFRIATEADSKDVAHSGHTDSVYYALVKEKQALDKQRLEARREKKRQRMRQEYMPNAQASMEVSGEQQTDAAGNSTASAPSTAAASSSAPAHEAPKLGKRGLLDPLLFLRAGSSVSGQTADASAAASSGASASSLKDVLHNAEAEYAALPLGQMDADKPQTQERGRPESRLPRGSAGSRQGSLDRFKNRGMLRGRQEAQDLRGKKRRPVSQEPRPVADAAPAARKVVAHQKVEEFLKEANLRCRKFALQVSFRNIMYHQQKKQRDENASSSVVNTPEKRLSPWDEYFRANHHFTRHGQFMHTRAFEADGRRILAVIPHPKRVCVDKVARAAQVPEKSVKTVKLGAMEKETGFPTFVCVPFGYPKDSQGRPPLLLVDSVVTEQKRPLLFDCGTVGLSVMPNEFVMMTRAACVEGLSVDPPANAVAVVQQAGKDLEKPADMVVSGPPQTLAPQQGLTQADVQQPAVGASSVGDAAMGS